jgi:hypothetical protein
LRRGHKTRNHSIQDDRNDWLCGHGSRRNDRLFNRKFLSEKTPQASPVPRFNRISNAIAPLILSFPACLELPLHEFSTRIVMPMHRLLWIVSMCLAVSTIALAGAPKTCVPVDQASKMLNKDVCITAHVYDVVELSNGTRFLDVCAPDVADELCRFTIVSKKQDRGEVGDLGKYRDTDVRVRGLVQPMRGRAGMFLSHERQFNGGPPKFKPNPRLASGFGAEQYRPPVSDPNLRTRKGHRTFMNSLAQDSRLAK